MKAIKSSLLMVFCLFAIVMQAQDDQKNEDKSQRPSPPAVATATVNGGAATIDYSQPSVKDRKIWGDLVPYDKVWRTGANEATTLTIENDVKIDGKVLKAGKYGLFTIPGKTEWTIIINSVWDQWGAYNYDASKDVMRFKVKPEKSDKFYEKLTYTIDNDGDVELMWDNLEVSFDMD